MGASLNGAARRGRGRRTRRAPITEINVTPFVDVMLVLLIIFMVTAPLLSSGVPLELPESRANALDQDPEHVTVSIDKQGFIFVDDAPVETGNLSQVLEQLGGPSDRPVITLRADTGIDYGRVMAVMGELNRAGFNAISLVTSSSSATP